MIELLKSKRFELVHCPEEYPQLSPDERDQQI